MKAVLADYIKELRTERDRQVRGYTIAKHYYALAEYEKAKKYLKLFHKLKRTAESFKLLGQCEAGQQQRDAAIKAYHLSLLHDEKQHELILEICKLLLEAKKLDALKANYWLRVAQREELKHETVVALYNKVLETLHKEPKSVAVKIVNVNEMELFTVEQQISYAQQLHELNTPLQTLYHIFDIELGHNEKLKYNAVWINVVMSVLHSYESQENAPKHWPYWLLKITYLERILCLTHPKQTANRFIDFLFTLDQALYEMEAMGIAELSQPVPMAQMFHHHFLAQMLFHAATFFVAREAMQQQPEWKHVLTLILPLLLIAYQLVNVQGIYNWLSMCKGQLKLLVHVWLRASAFRCLQIARVFRECVSSNDSHASKMPVWKTTHDLLYQIKQTYSHPKWRENIFSLLFLKECHKLRISRSMLVAGKALKEPCYYLPTVLAEIRHAELAQLHKPHSLQHMVYVAIGNEHFFKLQTSYFEDLPFSVNESESCKAVTLNHLDVDCFLYAACIQCKQYFSNIAESNKFIQHFACLLPPQVTDAQMRWWATAFRYCQKRELQNISAKDLHNLELGMETVRGLNGPKADILLIFHLADQLVQRTADVVKPVERSFIEARADQLYKCGLNMFKMSCANVLEPFGKYFTYPSCVKRQLQHAIHNGIAYVAARCLEKPAEYAQLIEEMSDIEHPLAGYLQFIDSYKLNWCKPCCPPKRKNNCMNLYRSFLGALVSVDDANLKHPLFTYLQEGHRPYYKFYFD